MKKKNIENALIIFECLKIANDFYFCSMQVGNITVCPGSSDPFYVVTYYIKWVTTSWTYGTYLWLTLQSAYLPC